MIDESQDLSYLLQQNRDHSVKIVDEIKNGQRPEPLKAEKSASLEDFIEMVGMLIRKTMKKQRVEFIPDEGARLSVDVTQKMDHPYITFDVISRVPSKELKPRVREVIRENIPDKRNQRTGLVWGQRQDAVIQFNIFACDYIKANDVMKKLEDLIFMYTAFFKKNGVAEVLFRQQGTDQNLDYYRQGCSVRSLQYSLSIEKLMVQYDSDIESIAFQGYETNHKEENAK